MDSFNFVVAVTGSVGSPDEFIFRVYGSSSSEIDWGLGAGWEAITDGNQLLSKGFEVTGNRTIKLRGTMTRVSFWGDTVPTSECTPTKLRDITSKMSDGISGINSAEKMFRGCTGITAFTQTDWFDDTVGNVTDMSGMFTSAAAFNQDIGGWDTSKVENMAYMFYNATAFNQDISSWNVAAVTNFTSFLQDASSFSTANYSKLLIAWAEQNLKTSKTFTTHSNSNYSLAAAGAKYRIMRDFTWTFTDGGIDTTIPDDPYIINNVQELQGMGVLLSSNFELAGNIDATATSGWGYSNIGFAPIGTSDASFTGTFDGQENTISNLYINRPATDYVGLFGRVTGTVQNVIIAGAIITGANRVSGVMGTLGAPGTLQNISVTNVNLTGIDSIGGAIGVQNSTTTSQNIKTSGVINVGTGGASWQRRYRGGLVGDLWGTLKKSYSSVTVNANQVAGGVVGAIESSGSIENCYSIGNVVVDSNSLTRGGLVGRNTGGQIINCYSTGTTNFPNEGSGGGGLVGLNTGTVTNSFWDTQTSGWVTSDGGTGKTTAQMRDINTFTGWDIVLIKAYTDQIWKIDSGRRYPMLGWEVFFIGILPLFRPKKGG